MHQIVTDTFEVDDPILYLNASHTGANANDLGIIINRGSSGDNVGIMWDRSAQSFALVTTTADGDSSGDLTFSAYADLQCRSLELQNFSFPLADGSNNQVLVTNGSGVLTWETAGGASLDGSTQITGTITPDVNNTYNLGSGALKLANVYTTTLQGQSTSAQYADVAELYTADEEILPGTVVCFGGTAEVTTQFEEHSTNIAGIVSTNPAHLMNSECTGEHVVEVALLGRVPCRVVGLVTKGDLLVSAGSGLARSEENPKLASIIGRAVESFPGGNGVIEVLVGRV